MLDGSMDGEWGSQVWFNHINLITKHFNFFCCYKYCLNFMYHLQIINLVSIWNNEKIINSYPSKVNNSKM